jgi:hypothetical protein
MLATAGSGTAGGSSFQNAGESGAESRIRTEQEARHEVKRHVRSDGASVESDLTPARGATRAAPRVWFQWAGDGSRRPDLARKYGVAVPLAVQVGADGIVERRLAG